ncbi:hypothetical protein ACGFX7_05995 [Streptomyces harbinensis]|uniref:hypothetical protein n=1 Tax=Streptomyces harbinensis TaxID=1176198 RepID=UPI00371A58EC
MMTTPNSDAPGSAVRAQWPGLRQVSPLALTSPPGEVVVRLSDPVLRFLVRRGGPDIYVRIGRADHLDRDDPDNARLYRQLTAWVEYQVPGPDPEPRGGSEWVMSGALHRTVRMPPAYVVAPDRVNTTDFAEAVWTALGMAMDNAEASLAHLRTV